MVLCASTAEKLNFHYFDLTSKPSHPRMRGRGHTHTHTHTRDDEEGENGAMRLGRTDADGERERRGGERESKRENKV